MVAHLLVAATSLMTIPARADAGDATDALPGVVRVPVVSPSARGLAAAASGGYGFTQGAGGPYSRATGALAVSYQPVPYFAAAVQQQVRYDVNTASGKASSTGDPRLELRGQLPVGDALRLGAQVGVWAPAPLPGASATSAITPDASLLASYAPPESGLVVTSRLGFRWDNSAHGVSHVASAPLSDRVELGINQASAVVTGLGASYRLTPRLELLGDVTWDVLVGSNAPGLAEAPILASAGVRAGLDADGELQLLGAVTVSPSERPALTSAVLVDVEPLVGVTLGLVFRPFARRPAPPVVIVPPPAPEVPAPPVVVVPARARLTGRAVAEDGVTPLAHAKVVVTPASGAEKQETETAADGRFETGELDAGDVTVDISAPGFTPIKKTVRLSGTPEPLDVVVKRALPEGEVRGVVRDLGGQPIMAAVRIDAAVAASGSPPTGKDVTVQPDGTFRADVQPGAYVVVIRAPGYADQKRRVTVERDGVIMVNVELRKQAR